MEEQILSKSSVVQALGNSFQADQEKLRAVTQYLTESSKMRGYSVVLMEIVDDPQTNEVVKQAALIQLKNTIKKFWKAKSFEIDEEQKQKIKSVLMRAVIGCAQSHKLIKLYKEIVTIIVGHEYKSWMPIDEIINSINSDQDIVPVLHMLIAIATSFEFSITDEERNYFYKLLKQILPVLNQLRQRNTNSEVIYLLTKFLWKSVHYDLSDQVKMLTTEWMDLIAMIVNLSNPDFDNNIDQPQTKGTPEFFYFHTKKWATRILMRFIQKHAKVTGLKKNQKNKQFSQYWYSNYGQKFVEILIHQFSVPTCVKVRYFQLKCIYHLATQKPNEIKQFAKLFQEDILLKFMALKPEDEQTAQADPLEFLARQTEPAVNSTNLKRTATQTWVAFAELGSQKQKKNSPYKPGIYFYDNMKYLQSRLQSNNLLQKQLAMYLICQLNNTIFRCNEIKASLPQLIETYVIPQFSNEVMFLRARAVDIFYQYGSIDGLSFELIQKATQGIYTCLINDQYPLVKIKAANAFNCILRHKNAQQLVRPLLSNILTVYLQLLEKYDLQSLVNSLQSIVAGFSDQIGPFAVDLSRYLSKLFIKMYQKDLQHSTKDDYDGEVQLAAAGCLKTLTQIIDAPISQQSIVAMESQVTALCEFIFASDSADYIEDILVLMNSYLHKLQIITPSMWFYYQVAIYNIVGIPKPMWDLIPNLPLTDQQKAVLNNIRSSQNADMIEQSMPVLRSYIQKGSNIIIAHEDVFKTNLMQLLFFMINQIYKKGPNDFTGEIDMTCCTALLIYLLENNRQNLPAATYVMILEIVKYNVTKVKSKTLKLMNAQLEGLLLWTVPKIVLQYIQKENIIEQFMKQLLVHENKLQEQHERQRLILGLSSLLKHSQKPQFLLQKYQQIFKALMKLVKKNADERINQVQLQQNQQAGDDEDEDLDELDENADFDDDQEAEFWEEQYDDNYESPLLLIDQIQQFQQTIQLVQSQQNDFYNFIIKTVPQEDLVHLSETVQKAKAALANKKSQ